MNVQYWLVTVQGYSAHHNPSQTTVTVILESDLVTPEEWFMSKPKCYHRFEFVPSAMLGYWQITKQQYEKYADKFQEQDRVYRSGC